MKKVEVTVWPDGHIKLETFGYVGKSCDDVDKIFKGLADNIKHTKKKEYYANEQPNDVNIVSGR
jgi:hypothetical protein